MISFATRRGCLQPDTQRSNGPRVSEVTETWPQLAGADRFSEWLTITLQFTYEICPSRGKPEPLTALLLYLQQSLPWTPSQALRPARWHATASSRYRARLAVARAVSFPSRRAEPLAPADAVSHPLRDTEGAFPVAKHPAKRVSSLAFTRGLRILFFVEAHNGMSQARRAHLPSRPVSFNHPS